MDIHQLRDLVEYDYDYVESEGPNCIRFDRGERSAWAYANGSFDGDARIIKALRKVADKMVDSTAA